ncbi:acyl-CoA dehydrogenase family protein [Salinicoccus halitifaciens]|uniref:Alkylation response protein AidB-like acyl-CoA dehydrogenase n=1 Tax=Salinicoccus halitifaciens TaxID=1073415 RepID=A0ABV2E9D4_9STAP|nr:acyl-CoA dehydrogenase family protein [Salinicoccus halitifaciens]MCD2137890.1 acyl-CoA dehydrogenase family protein [Salinicoccus halitifaciens]
MIDENMIEMIRKAAPCMEREGRLTNEVLQYIYDKGLFKLFLPEETGGNMQPLPEALKIFEEAARADGSFGWLVQIGSGAGFFAVTMEPDEVREHFTARDFYIAGSDRPGGTARKVDDGYIVNGTWPFSSGSDHASLFTATCRIKSGDQDNGKLYAFAFTPDQVTIERDWDAFGMRATGSHTIRVEDAFVPASRRFDVTRPHFYFDDPVYHYPFRAFATANIASTAIGVARHFFEAAREHIESKKDAWGKAGSSRYGHAVEVLEKNEAAFLEARKDFYHSVEKSWKAHVSRTADAADMTDISMQSKIAARAGIRGVQNLYSYFGMDIVMRHHPLNRIYRDLLTASQHALLVDSEGELEGYQRK